MTHQFLWLLGGNYSPRINGKEESPSLKLKAQNGNVTQAQ